MKGDIYEKLAKVREALKKESINNFSELMDAVSKKTKRYNILPLYCFYDNVATLTLVDMDNIAMCLKFQIPVDMVGLKGVKQYLYSMAFEVDIADSLITLKQAETLLEKMDVLKVNKSEILERYNISNLSDMTTENYKRCMSALDRLNNRQQS